MSAPEQPASRQPQAVPPSAPRRQPPPTLATEPDIKPGDLICAVCGTGNDPTRRFCRRCGNSLATAVVAIKPPWYRRLLGRRQRHYAAGERPGAMGTAGQPRRSRVRLVVALVVVLLIAGAAGAYFLNASFHDQVTSAIGSVGRLYDTWSHPPSQAYDSKIETYWLADSSSGQPTLTMNLAQATNMVGIRFQMGSSAGPDFSTYARPKTVELQLPGAAPVRLLLKDDPAAQEFPVTAAAVQTLTLRILDWYPAVDPGQPLIAVREITVIGQAP
jgi:hypothetical protein